MTNKKTEVRLIIAKNILNIPNTFGQIFRGLRRQKLEGVRPITACVKLLKPFKNAFFIYSGHLCVIVNFG